MCTLTPVSLKTVVVATDLSHTAADAVEQGAALARRCGANLWMLHVFNDGFWAHLKGVYTFEGWPGDEPSVSARKRLSQQGRDIADRYGVCFTGETRSRHAAAEIVCFLDECGADLVVVGKQGDSSVGDAFFGGTALRVLK